MNDLFKNVLQLWCDVLNLEINDTNASFYALGGSSMQSIELLNRINHTFAIELALEDFIDTVTISEQVELIQAKINEAVLQD